MPQILQELEDLRHNEFFSDDPSRYEYHMNQEAWEEWITHYYGTRKLPTQHEYFGLMVKCMAGQGERLLLHDRTA